MLTSETVLGGGAKPRSTPSGLKVTLDDTDYRVTYKSRWVVLVQARRGDRRAGGSLKLWSSRSLEGLAKHFESRLSLSREVAEKHLWSLVDRIEEGRDGAPASEEPVAFSEEAMSYLRQPDVVERILADCTPLGYIGEAPLMLWPCWPGSRACSNTPWP